MNLWKEFSKGLWEQLPPFRILLGLCPTLAVTTSAENGLGMGIAVIFVLTLSNTIVSLVRDFIPKKVRIACFIVIAATLVTSVELLMQAYTYTLYQQLGIFVPLIVVNCIILGRAEAFASKNPVIPSFLDGLGIGIGFACSLVVIASIREVLGKGTWFGISLFGENFEPFTIMSEGPGGFIVLGILLMVMNISSAYSIKKKQHITDPSVLVEKGQKSTPLTNVQ